MLALTGGLFAAGALSTFLQAALWTVMFFFASPAASSAYLTVGEIFPLEMRALSISIFYSAGTVSEKEFDARARVDEPPEEPGRQHAPQRRSPTG